MSTDASVKVLSEKAHSYFRDADRLKATPGEITDGHDGEWWSTVYAAVANELRKIQRELEAHHG